MEGNRVEGDWRVAGICIGNKLNSTIQNIGNFKLKEMFKDFI